MENNVISQVTKLEYPLVDKHKNLNIFFESRVFYEIDSVVWVPFLGNFILSHFSVDSNSNLYKYVATSLSTKRNIFKEDKPPLYFIGKDINLYNNEDARIAINNSLYC